VRVCAREKESDGGESVCASEGGYVMDTCGVIDTAPFDDFIGTTIKFIDLRT